jgi:ADP-ribosyl-[dinitrogen reductase] hydrolase
MKNALLGALVADAVSLPVHWYYDTDALDRDYPDLETYQAPRNPHPGSILWRSKHVPVNAQAEILHEQAQYWGQRGIHYHQFLPAGGNTLNFLLGLELYRQVVEKGHYSAKAWLHRYIECLQTPGWHKDTYLEEYHRAFFNNLARGQRPERCGIKDIHIGGLTPVPFLVAALDRLGGREVAADVALVQSHLALTHHGHPVASAGRAFTEILYAVARGEDLRAAIAEYSAEWASARRFEKWSGYEDRVVVGRQLTPACYLPDSFTAALYLAWKYHDDFSAGVIANARCGGDNAHRGAVVGALLGVHNGILPRWLDGLVAADAVGRGTAA